MKIQQLLFCVLLNVINAGDFVTNGRINNMSVKHFANEIELE